MANPGVDQTDSSTYPAETIAELKDGYGYLEVEWTRQEQSSLRRVGCW
jgi:hypothetical protein